MDTMTVALTGPPLGILLIAVILAWPISWWLLVLYKRAVLRSMLRSSHDRGAHPPLPPAPPIDPHRPAAGVVLHTLDGQPTSSQAQALVANLASGPTRAVAAYACGGAAYAITSTVLTIVATKIEFFPVRTLMFAWLFAWPLVVTVGLVTPRGHRLKRLVPIGYVAGLAAIIWISVTLSPSFTWAQGVLLWALNNLAPTLILLPYFSRHVRAVGPLVMTLMLLVLLGGHVTLSLATGRDSHVRVLADISTVTGVSAAGTLAIIALVGAVVFGLVGWAALTWIGRRYQAKRISDESVMVDTVWLLFAFSHLIGLVFEDPLWIVATFVALAAYKAGTRVGFWWWRRPSDGAQKTPVLLLLRSFSLGKASERLFDALERYWRHAGSIQLIAGVDLATRTIEPHEFLDFMSGKLARRFIDGPAALAQRVNERDLGPDPDLRYRVNDFFCFNDTWRMVLLRLLDESDVVLMDLRGFSEQNAGCVFEIRQIVTLGALHRVVFIVDERTDEQLFTSTLDDAAATTPGASALNVGVFRAQQKTGPDVRRLLAVLASQATVLSGPRVQAPGSSVTGNRQPATG